MEIEQLLYSSDSFKNILSTYNNAKLKYIKEKEKIFEDAEQIIKHKYPIIWEFGNKFFSEQTKQHNDLNSALNVAGELLKDLYLCWARNLFRIFFSYYEWPLRKYLNAIVQDLCFKYNLDYSRFAEIEYVDGTIEFEHRRLTDKNINNIFVLIDWIKNNYISLVTLYSIEMDKKKPVFNFEFDISELSENNQKVLKNIHQTEYLSIKCY